MRTAALEFITDLKSLYLMVERAAIEATLRVTREGNGNESEVKERKIHFSNML